jgi:protein-S-isoprenylcysteine O-methyltransferase Ste14
LIMLDVSTGLLSFLSLKIPPPVVALVTGTLMWSMSRQVPAAAFDFPGHAAMAMCLALTGFMVDLAGLVSFRLARTTTNPLTPDATTALVVIGIYRYTRNPMYVGLLLVLVGWAIYLSNALCWAGIPLAAMYLTRFQIIPEELILTKKFGAGYKDYQANVRRWL